MKVILVCGTRPNFIKIASLLRAIKKFNEKQGRLFKSILVHTGQHYDYEMSQIFFQDLELPKPDIYLGVGSGTHAEQTSKVMVGFEKTLLQEKPELVIVVGDVNSTFAAALAAVKLHIPVAHVEAGLRSYDLKMPEEVNRLLTDHVSDYLFTTSKLDDDNLKREGISADRIFLVGNIMVDSLLFSKQVAERSNIMSRLNLTRKNYALLTLHRPSNVDDKKSFTRIISALRQIAQKIPVVFPAHPRTQKNIAAFGLNIFFEGEGIKLVEPQGYLDFLNLEMNSRFVITDSGGIQVETTALGIPCLTVLHTPVWLITYEQGTNTLVGDDGQQLTQEAFKILNGDNKVGICPELWDGKTAKRIVAILARGYNRAGYAYKKEVS